MRIYIILEDSDIYNKESRLDILHQSLLILQDSIINKELKLNVYIRTIKNELIQVNPTFSVPKTLELFQILIQSLIIHRKIKSNNNTILLQMIKNDWENIRPINSYSIGLSTLGHLENLKCFISKYDFKQILIIHIGTTSSKHSKGTIENVDDIIKISKHPLTAAHCISKIITELTLHN